MSSELRLKKLRGSGGYIMATVTDEQQMKGNLGGPDLFLAPIGRLDSQKITKHFCNTCEKEFEGSPKIVFENPNEEVAENLILAEKGQYICNSCNSSIAEYREFKKQDESGEVGSAKPLEPQNASQQATQPQQIAQTPKEIATKPGPATSVTSIDGRAVFDENANKVGTAKQVGIDSTQSMVLVIAKEDGTEGSVPWSNIKKIGQIILLGKQEISQSGKCPNCGFGNKEGSKFCEDCGTKI
ncbi:MAG: zinc-ribbon domain-containing protein [Nitrosopumilus sp.]|nr:zinc-ribbon domain-containing protein [Nitrosopumilus sp.]